jgi:hypothetical protein
VKQQGSFGTWTRLGQHLRRQHPEREPGIDDLVRQAVGGESTALDDRVEADLLGVANAVGEFGEGLAFAEIRGVNDVSGSAELIGEGEAPGRQPLCMMEKQKLSHVRGSLTGPARRRSDRNSPMRLFAGIRCPCDDG